jgi:membrane protein YdbS with pleckstrin-like domain
MRRKHRWLAAQAVVRITLLALVIRSLDLYACRALFARLSAGILLAVARVVLAGQMDDAWRRRRWRLPR